LSIGEAAVAVQLTLVVLGRVDVVVAAAVGGAVVAVDSGIAGAERQSRRAADHLLPRLSRSARAVEIVTVEPAMATVPEHVGIGDAHDELLGAYPGIDCYHSAADGSRDHDIDTTENYECELHRNGGFTYFSFASIDADPGQRIGAIGIATRRID
jgi:hypothetical protein